MPDERQETVGSRLAGSVKAGEAVCPLLYPGAFGFAWYDVRGC